MVFNCKSWVSHLFISSHILYHVDFDKYLLFILSNNNKNYNYNDNYNVTIFALWVLEQ